MPNPKKKGIEEIVELENQEQEKVEEYPDK